MASHVSVGALSASGDLHRESPAETLRERFHGALLGLWLTPVAVSLVGDCRSSANDSVGIDSLGPNPHVQEMAATLVDGFALIQAFASDTDAFRQPLSVLLETVLVERACQGLSTCPLPVWLVSLPMLLRYHDSRSLRLQWLDLQQSSLRAVAHANHLPWAITIEQIIQLGDFLEMALSGWTPPLLDYVTELRGESPFQSTVPTATVPTATVPTATVPTMGRDDFATVLTSALGGSPEAFFSLGSVLPPALLRTKSCKSEQMLIIGLLAGVLKGAGQLPVLWQLTGPARSVYGVDLGGKVVSRVAVMGMANRLFDQWAGIQPI